MSNEFPSNQNKENNINKVSILKISSQLKSENPALTGLELGATSVKIKQFIDSLPENTNEIKFLTMLADTFPFIGDPEIYSSEVDALAASFLEANLEKILGIETETEE